MIGSRWRQDGGIARSPAARKSLKLQMIFTVVCSGGKLR
jgi:hypothetical protein